MSESLPVSKDCLKLSQRCFTTLYIVDINTKAKRKIAVQYVHFVFSIGRLVEDLGTELRIVNGLSRRIFEA